MHDEPNQLKTANCIQAKMLIHKIINLVTKLRGGFKDQLARSLCIPQKTKSYSSSTKHLGKPSKIHLKPVTPNK